MGFQFKNLKHKFLERAFCFKEHEDPLYILKEIAGFILLLILTIYFIKNRLSIDNPKGSTLFLFHTVNLVFHEAGHILFMPFGIFIMKLGGTLLQCLVPLIFLIYFLKERESFAASTMFWWFGQNFLDISPYVYDAKRLSLPLTSGRTGRADPNSHDWYWLLNRMGVREHCESIALFIENLGILLLLLALTWSFLFIYKKGLKELSSDRTSSFPLD